MDLIKPSTWTCYYVDHFKRVLAVRPYLHGCTFFFYLPNHTLHFEKKNSALGALNTTNHAILISKCILRKFYCLQEFIIESKTLGKGSKKVWALNNGTLWFCQSILPQRNYSLYRVCNNRPKFVVVAELFGVYIVVLPQRIQSFSMQQKPREQPPKHPDFE